MPLALVNLVAFQDDQNGYQFNKRKTRPHLQLRYVPVLYLVIWRIIRPAYVEPFHYLLPGQHQSVSLQ